MRAKTSIFRFDNVSVDAAEFRVLKDGKTVTLEPKAFQLLLFLLEQRGRLVTKDELLDAVWADSYVTPNALTRIIAQLRRELGDASQNSRYIETVPTRGYRFIAEVEEIDVQPTRENGDAFRKTEEPIFESAQTEELIEQVEARQELKRRPAFAFLALTALLIIATAGVAYFLYTKNGVKSEANFQRPQETIAVLPFKLISPNDENGYLSVGLADSLITKLSNVASLTVRPTSSVVRYPPNETDPASAGRDLQVAFVMDGAVQRDNDRVRVTVQLIRVADGKPIWANSYDTRFVDIFQVQDEISTRITDALEVRLSSDEQTRLRRPPTDNIEAYQNYLRGNESLSKFSRENLMSAIKYFDQAIAQDSNYALAYAKLANVYALATSFGIPSAIELEEKNARKAVELDPNLGEAHTSIAVLQFWNYHDIGKSQDSFVHSLELNPNSAYTHLYYGWFLVATGHFDEAERHIQRAVEIDPLSPNTRADQGLPYYYSGRYEEARRFYQKSLEGNDGFWYGHVRLAEVCEALGDADCALGEIKRGAELSPYDPALRSELVRILVLAGKKDEARKVMREITAKDAPPIRPYFLALAYEALGEPDEVFAALDRSLNEKDGWFCWIKVDPRLDPLRSDPRFDELLLRTNLK
jgi:TolB-like protein/DNA-binding winged helix-turn-helix (wHTH) protein/Tfp pilus assembly protein PilF